jgi:hypothetical protein
VFERLFQERGLPGNIRSDKGVPFASAHALFNLWLAQEPQLFMEFDEPYATHGNSASRVV